MTAASAPSGRQRLIQPTLIVAGRRVSRWIGPQPKGFRRWHSAVAPCSVSLRWLDGEQRPIPGGLPCSSWPGASTGTLSALAETNAARFYSSPIGARLVAVRRCRAALLRSRQAPLFLESALALDAAIVGRVGCRVPLGFRIRVATLASPSQRHEISGSNSTGRTAPDSCSPAGLSPHSERVEPVKISKSTQHWLAWPVQRRAK